MAGRSSWAKYIPPVNRADLDEALDAAHGRREAPAAATIGAMTSLVPLIETTRGGTPECLHFGAVAVTDTQGRVLASAGHPHWLTFTRSTLKALQALPFMQADGPQKMGFTRENIAMMCASHSGEPMHVAQVQEMLDKAGLTYQRLQCGCHVPMFVELGVAPAPAQYDERNHNCSGKHSGFLAMCVQQGWPVESYLDPGHPLQQAIRQHVARAVGLAPEALKMGVDGCSAPNYAMPLANLARGYARLASGSADAEFGESFAQLADAMTARPDLVSGTARNDLAFMRAGRGDWVTKVGADGVQAFASRSRGQAFAIKIADGSKVALHAATVAVLDQLGWLDEQQREALQPWRADTIASIKGAPVGERKAVFALRFER
jgi:L-asparaginase II